MNFSTDDLVTMKTAIEYSLASSSDENHDMKCAILYPKICSEIIKRAKAKNEQ